MFSLLHRSKLTLNKHIDVSENYANNMRLFEATGTGACLITDWKDNLADLFEPQKEVVAYRSSEECLDLIAYYARTPAPAKPSPPPGKRAATATTPTSAVPASCWPC